MHLYWTHIHEVSPGGICELHPIHLHFLLHHLSRWLLRSPSVSIKQHSVSFEIFLFLLFMGTHKFSLLMKVTNYVYFLCININLKRVDVWTVSYIFIQILFQVVSLLCLKISIGTTFKIRPASTQFPPFLVYHHSPNYYCLSDCGNSHPVKFLLL